MSRSPVPSRRPCRLLAVAVGLTLGACSPEPVNSCCSETPPPAAASVTPDSSVYQLLQHFTDQTGVDRQLGDFRGRPVVMSMIFTHCTFACPTIAADLLALLDKMSKRADVHVVLVSMDAARDESKALAAFAEQHQLPADRFTLLHGDADTVRELSVVLGIRFAQVEGGSFSHSNLLSLLDHDGCIVARLEGLRADPAPLLAAIAKLELRPLPPR